MIWWETQSTLAPSPRPSPTNGGERILSSPQRHVPTTMIHGMQTPPRALGTLLLLSVVAAGLAGCQRASPESPRHAIVVEARYPGANARVIAETVAAPIEQQINGI